MLDKQGRVRQASVDRAAALVRELMQRYGIPANRVVRHYDVTHKDCPAPMVQNPALWQAFQTKLTQEDENDMKYYEKLTEIPAGELRETVQLLIVRGGNLCQANQPERYFAGHPVPYLDPVGGVLTGLQHKEVGLLEDNIIGR